MTFHHVYKVLVVADGIAERAPMRLRGAAILQHLRQDHQLRVDIVRNTRDALTELERDASVATALIEWGDESSTIDTRRIVERMAEIGLEAPIFVVVSDRGDLPAVRSLLAQHIAGFILTDEDTPDFIARLVKRHLVVAQFLRERGIVPEKNDINTILFLVTPGIETSKAGTLISALVAFKQMFDANEPLAKALPAFTKKHQSHYADTGIRDLCVAMHRFYRVKE